MFLIFFSVKHLNDFFQVAVNKLDTVKWSQDRFDEIVAKLKQFLKQVGFKDSDVRYVPCSGNPTQCRSCLIVWPCNLVCSYFNDLGTITPSCSSTFYELPWVN